MFDFFLQNARLKAGQHINGNERIPVSEKIVFGVMKNVGPLTKKGRKFFFRTAREMIERGKGRRIFECGEHIIIVRTDFELVLFGRSVGMKFYGAVFGEGMQTTFVDYIVAPEIPTGKVSYVSIPQSDYAALRHDN